MTVDWPAALRPRRAACFLDHLVAFHESPISRDAQRLLKGEPFWRLEADFGPYDQARAGELDATLALLKGSLGTTSLHDFRYPTPVGSGAVSGGHASLKEAAGVGTTSLSTQGWAANETVLRQGDKIGIGVGTRPVVNMLFVVRADVASDGNGEAIIDVEPPLRFALPAGSEIATTQARADFMLDPNQQDQGRNLARRFDRSEYSLKFVEDLARLPYWDDHDASHVATATGAGVPYLEGKLSFDGPCTLTYALSVSADNDTLRIEFYHPDLGWAPANVYELLATASSNAGHSSTYATAASGMRLSKAPSDDGNPVLGKLTIHPGLAGPAHVELETVTLEANDAIVAMNWHRAVLVGAALPTRFRIVPVAGPTLSGTVVVTTARTDIPAASASVGPWRLVAEESGSGVASIVASGLPAAFAWRLEIDLEDNPTNDNQAIVEFGPGADNWPVDTTNGHVQWQDEGGTNDYFGTGGGMTFPAVSGPRLTRYSLGGGGEGLSNEPGNQLKAEMLVFEPGAAASCFGLVHGCYMASDFRTPHSYSFFRFHGAWEDGEIAARTDVRVRLEDGASFTGRLRVWALEAASLDGQWKIEAGGSDSGVGAFTLPLSAEPDALYTEYLVRLNNLPADRTPQVRVSDDGGTSFPFDTKYMVRTVESANIRYSATSGATSGDDAAFYLVGGGASLGDGCCIRLRVLNPAAIVAGTQRPLMLSELVGYDTGLARAFVAHGVAVVQGVAGFDALVLELEEGGSFDYAFVAHSLRSTQAALPYAG